MCCHNVPIEKEVYERNRDKRLTAVIEEIEFSGLNPVKGIREQLVLPRTKDGRCPFLCEDLRCNIYEDRPHVCRLYGQEARKCLRCPFQDKNGRIRSRQERRQILRDADEEAKKLMNQ